MPKLINVTWKLSPQERELQSAREELNYWRGYLAGLSDMNVDAKYEVHKLTGTQKFEKALKRVKSLGEKLDPPQGLRDKTFRMRE